MTDPEARLYRKGSGKEAILCYMSHVLAEGRSGLVVDYRTTQAEGTAEPKAGLETKFKSQDGSKRIEKRKKIVRESTFFFSSNLFLLIVLGPCLLFPKPPEIAKTPLLQYPLRQKLIRKIG